MRLENRIVHKLLPRLPLLSTLQLTTSQLIPISLLTLCPSPDCDCEIRRLKTGQKMTKKKTKTKFNTTSLSFQLIYLFILLTLDPLRVSSAVLAQPGRWELGL